MRDAILGFPKQFKFRPKIEGGKVKKYKKFLVCGMGGSPQPAEVLKSIMPELDIAIHKDYNLPAGDWKKTLVVAISYSGNTEEPVSTLDAAVSAGLPVVAIGKGGALIENAKKYSVPYVAIPDTGIQPRSATGFLFMALLKVMKLNELSKNAKELAKTIDPKSSEQPGKDLAQRLRGSVPVIYASGRNYPLAYMWKIKFNETGKIPAFYNVIPELNHNEINGMDVKDVSRELSRNFYFIMHKDSEDSEKIRKRMEVTEKLYRDRGLRVETLEISGATRMDRIFSTLLLGDWVAYHIAEDYGLESEQVPIVEEFKKLIA